ncbi:glycoside hydrolase family 3 protein [Ornithinimicrobium avium]|uniref:beta-N-acetylhexosaminidase n=2 Tax=Ornithinimicrobium avium TaxID=2283195 RepID=A0A345NII2_9MICO|nr:glycoside hydrolase family 3 protein [Ornithinimicrobium avium]
MVALQVGSAPSSLAPVVQDGHVGNILYLGGWTGSIQDIAAASATVQALATRDATGGIGLLVAADQEGGEVQQLRGPGFSTIPTALVQATLGAEELTREATVWGEQLVAAGINLNLAPVADVVPAELGTSNGPVGRWGREYGHDPQTVAAGIVPFIHGMQQAGVATSVKHFPGIGRITGNPDFTTDGLVDDVLTADDPYLDAFSAGIEAGASTVMVSSALYPRIDPDHPAMFSPAIIDGLLRRQLGYDGVVISDDVNAAAVRGLTGVRPATDLVAAGGDVVLTGDTASGARMVEQVADLARTDPAFAAKVDASLLRVLELKDSLGLLPCS